MEECGAFSTTEFVLITVLVLLLLPLLCFRRAAARAHTSRREQLAAIVERSISTTKRLSYPAAFVRASDFVACGRLKSFEELRNDGMLTFCDTFDALVRERRFIVFLSHQVRFRPHSSPCARLVLCLRVPCVRARFYAGGVADWSVCAVQWTGWTHPDTDNEQFPVMVAAIQCIAKDLLADGAASSTADDVLAALASMLVWVECAAAPDIHTAPCGL